MNSPLDVLKEKVPAAFAASQTDFHCDPDLDCRNMTSPQQWSELSAEAELLMRQYNLGLMQSIQADKADGQLGSLSLYLSSGL